MNTCLKKILVPLCFLLPFLSNGQEAKDSIIQFSGIIVQGDSMYAVPGAFVYVPNTSRGAVTTMVGYFNIPVVAGDSVIIAALGYEKQFHKIPADSGSSYSVIIRLKNDTIALPEVSISSFPSERVFKEVFLAMNIDERNIDNMNRNLNKQIMNRIMSSQDIDGSLAYKYYMNQQVYAIETQYMAQTSNFLNPFAWASFFQSIKDEKERKKKEAKERRNNSGY